jgi:hypothetical protein
MPNLTDSGALFERAHSAAEDLFDTDTSTGNADKVCAVGLSVVSDQTASHRRRSATGLTPTTGAAR